MRQSRAGQYPFRITFSDSQYPYDNHCRPSDMTWIFQDMSQSTVGRLGVLLPCSSLGSQTLAHYPLFGRLQHAPGQVPLPAFSLKFICQDFF
ncbi:hypothetical protein SISSUDRAFT_1050413 [Sistotremastrum suecicum HHB10207 ss-3]|uniref:Uncharacterized protein n=1 Tax=Sistotremastrum suecicum HHB10207 ss-3 TaxID=1314776 RepID=A0A166B6T2_9AGAM|nr:hypothetical protein SISSUDRAFT_1050413 [Sistotremastrum suecicum HHB10207 ss-3]